MLGVAVHTTGVNWDGVLANVASITVVLSVFGAVIVKLMRNSIKDQITAVVRDEVTPKLDRLSDSISGHDTRIARLEGMEEGKRQAIAAAGVTTAS
jgi:hypothetical protein